MVRIMFPLERREKNRPLKIGDIVAYMFNDINRGILMKITDDAGIVFGSQSWEVEVVKTPIRNIYSGKKIYRMIQEDDNLALIGEGEENNTWPGVRELR